PHTAAPALREASLRLSPPGAPHQVPVRCVPEANSADGRCDRHRGDRSETPWRRATVHATTHAWPAALVDLADAPARCRDASARTLHRYPARPPDDATGPPRRRSRVA